MAKLFQIIPKSIRKKVKSLIFGDFVAQREAVLRDIPKVELAVRHIQNLKVLLDRASLVRAMPKGGVVAELGINRGDFSEEILRLAQPTRLHLVDAWGSERYHLGLQQLVRNKFKDSIASGQVLISVGMSTNIVNQFPDNYFDWIYIDTDHSYSVTSAELRCYEPKMKKDGIIAGHDFSMGNWKSGIKYGVIEAVYEFCSKRDWEIIFLTAENATSQSFAIRKIATFL